MASPMPILGGAEKFASSHLFATDCVVSKFGAKKEAEEDAGSLSVECGSGNGGKGIVCRR